MTHIDEGLAPSLRRVATAFVRSTPRSGLSRSAAGVLSHLERRGPLRITQLAADEAVSQPAMTQLVQRLESAGHVERTSDPDDRRATRIAVTATGLDALEHRRSDQDATIATHLDQLPADLLDALASARPALERLTDLMEDHALA